MCPQNVCKIVCVAGLYVVFYVVQLTVLLLNAVHPSYTRLTPVLHPSYTRRTPAPADFSNTRTYTRAISGIRVLPIPVPPYFPYYGYMYYPYPYPSPKPRGGHASDLDTGGFSNCLVARVQTTDQNGLHTSCAVYTAWIFHGLKERRDPLQQGFSGVWLG